MKNQAALGHLHQEMDSWAKIIGIDLGTTNSVVAIMDGKEPKVIVNEEGDRTTPSVVAWDEQDEVLVGQIAKRQAITNPEDTVYSAKRFIGRRFDETVDEAKRMPYKVVKRDNGDAGIEVRGKTLSPPEVGAHVLRKLKKAAEDYLGETVTEAVITVPAYFNDAQRQATKDAGRIAGLDVKRIVNEPTAAALAYGLDKKKDEIIAVYDFGGGTFDISILEVGDNVVQVISTNGDTHLGGDDVDQRVIDYLVAEFKRDQGIDVSKDKMVLQRLKDAAEKAKIELSSQAGDHGQPAVPHGGRLGPEAHEHPLTRAKLEQMIEDLVAAHARALQEGAGRREQDARPTSTRSCWSAARRASRMVQETVKKFFGKEPHQGVNPDEVVAIGAAVQAGVLSGDVKDMVLLDVTPLSLGVETLGGVMTALIPRNTTIPTRREETFSTADDSQTKVEIHVLQGERAEARDNRTLGPLPPRGHHARAARRAEDQGHLRHRRQRHPLGHRQGRGHRQGSAHHHHGGQRSERDRDPADGRGGQGQRGRRQAASRGDRDAQPRRPALPGRSRRRSPRPRTSCPPTRSASIENNVKNLRAALEKDDAAAIKSGMETLEKSMHELAQVAYQGGRRGARWSRWRGPRWRGPRCAKKDKKDDGVIDAEFEDGN